MFKIAQSPTYYWPVKVRVPADGGQWEEHTFDAKFKRLPQSEVDAMRADVLTGNASDVPLARKLLVGWKGVTIGDDEAPFSETTRDQLLEVPGVATAVVVAFVESLSGARRGN
jgi:hypothetical protein